MGFAASHVAGAERFRRIAYVGLAIVYVASDMIRRGLLELQAHAFVG